MTFGKVIKIISILAFTAVGLYFTVFAILANFDLSVDRFVLHCDEHITFDGVKTILHPTGIGGFFNSILNGGDHRYGRVLWNISALFSFIPELIFGSQGQIIATRMTQFLALTAAYVILVLTFITSWPLRAVGFLLLWLIPTTSYYVSMPKPEPLQLLFLALFLRLAQKKGFGFNKHWFYLGLAFAAKISALMLIPFFAFLAFLKNIFENTSKKIKKSNLFCATKYFIFGFLLGEPLIFLALVKFRPGYIRTYLNWTFFNTGFGGDDATVNFFAWLKHLFYYYTSVPIILSILILFSIVILFATGLKICLFKDGFFKNRNIFLEKHFYSLIFLFVGSVLMIMPMLFIKRIWLVYLHNGMAIFLIGALSLVEYFIRNGIKPAKYLSFLLLGFLVTAALFYLLPSSTKEYINLSKRSVKEIFQKQLGEYNYIKGTLEKISRKAGRKIIVFFDTNLLLMESTEKVQIEPYYGYFKFWSKDNDVLVCYKISLEDNLLLPKTSASYNDQQEAFALLKEHVASSGRDCQASPCYYRFPSKLDNLTIYVNSKLFSILGDPEEGLK